MANIETIPNLATPHQQAVEYLAGYFDMTGAFSLGIKEIITEKREGWEAVFRMDLARMHTQPLALMKRIFPAKESSHKTQNNRLIPRWYAVEDQAAFVFDQLKPHLRLKAGHVEVLDRFLNPQEDIAIDELLDMKDNLKELNKNPKPNLWLPFTEPYMAGVVDAHSYLKIISDGESDRLTLKINPGNKDFAEEIVRQYTILDPETSQYNLDKGYVVLTGRHAKFLLQRVWPNLIVYRNLAKHAIDFQNIRDYAEHAHHGKRGQKRKAEEAKVIQLFNEEFEMVRRKQGRPKQIAA